MEKKIERLERKEVFNGKRVKLVIDKLRMPTGKEVNWELVTHPGAAAIIPVDNEGNIIMVRQYRNAADDYVLEIPAGGLEVGEDPSICAKRELEEETGYKSDNIEFLLKFYSSIGISDEMISIYVATDLQESVQNLDDDEYVTIERYKLDELINMIYTGELTDCKTITGLLAYKCKLEGIK
ncbi:ADP-ribose pyrophosphatase [Vallitalea longa]|uniref:ADP-ribose pyrophosphatase n=1 Tax=Vallitalea longa TaxID=2936439 RepID=A0A9W5YH41_9FIRM|nr:NUDIX hydrolase [Vallitalea longa]GKX31824.1 ADP-ribose pyrophosphatase [Vallitalea longa]